MDMESHVDKIRCAFYLERKRRNCKTIPKDGMKYCVEHSHLMGDGAVRKRIPCPLDGKHSCYEDQLEKHLKKCNAREKPKPVYFVKNVNSGEDNGDAEGETKMSLLNVPVEEVFEVIEKVRALCKEHTPTLEDAFLSHSVFEEELKNPANGDVAMKHCRQQASLLGHIEALNLLHDYTCFVEFGAGRGQLSHWVRRALPTCQDMLFVLVDRSACRYKWDNLHKGETGAVFERLRIDIEHLCLGKLPSVSESLKPVVGMSKHLCGAATDLGLRCMVTTLNVDDANHETRIAKESQEPEIKKRKTESRTSSYLSGLVIALCCHHRCNWKNYVGKDFFRECGLNGKHFDIITSMSSWATCAAPSSKNENIQQKQETETELNRSTEINADNKNEDMDPTTFSIQNEQNEHEETIKNGSENKKGVAEAEAKSIENESMGLTELGSGTLKPLKEDTQHENVSRESCGYNHPRYGSLTPEEREYIGYQCKRLIDVGRIRYLQLHGCTASLKRYVESSVSLENVVLLAKPKDGTTNA